MTIDLADLGVTVYDCHVHLMPARLMAAIRRSLTEAVGWEFTHPVDQAAMESLLGAHGINRYCALPYAHKPGIADDLNAWVQSRADDSAMCIPFATVHGEDDVHAVIRDAFEAGARGLKFQCPVQEVGPDDPRLDPAFELAAEYDRPILFHAGTAPMFTESPHVGVDAFRSFCERYPEVRACAAHMGAFETDEFLSVLDTHENAYLDTCFAMSTHATEYMKFDPAELPDSVFVEYQDRIMYGSDFPNIPYEYEAERAGILGRELPRSVYRSLFSKTARDFLDPV